MRVGVVRTSAPTSTGTFDLTVSGYGTCKGAYFWITYATADATAADGASLGVGATDGTRDRAAATSSAHNLTDTKTFHRAKTGKCILLLNPTNGNIDGEAQFDSFITDGIRLNCTDAFSAGFKLHAVLFFDQGDTSIYVGDFDTVSADVDVTAPNFTPRIVGVFGTRGPIDGTSYAGARMSVGWCSNDSSVTQTSMNWGEENSRTTGSPYVRYETANISRDLVDSTVGGAVSLGTFDSQGFTATRVNSAGYPSCYIAIKCDNHSNSVTITTPSSSGVSTPTSFGFCSQALFGQMSRLRTANANNETSLAGCFGLHGADSTTNEFSSCIGIEDAAATTNTQSFTDVVMLRLQLDTGAGDAYAGDLNSITSTGITINYTTVDSNIRAVGILAVQKMEFTALAVSAPRATAAISAKRVINASIAATATRATAAVSAKHVIQTGSPSTDFSGTSQVLTGTEPARSATMTIEFWAMFDAPTVARSIMGVWKATTVTSPPERCWRFRTDTNGNLNFDWQDLTAGLVTVTHNVTHTTNRGYHVVAVVNSTASEIRLYIDASDVRLSQAIALNTQPSDFAVGTISGTITSNHFDGRIARLRIWTRALSQSEVVALYNGGRGLKYSQLGLVAGMTTNLSSAWELDQYVSGTYQPARQDSHTSGINLTGTTGWSQGPGSHPQASTATTAISTKRVHQTTDGSVAASRATAALSSQIVHQVAQLAIDFRNGNDYLRSLDDSWSVDTSGQRTVTIACWVFANNVDTLIIGQWGPSSLDQQFCIQWTGLTFAAFLTDDGGSAGYGAESAIVSPYEWHHLVLTVDFDTHVSVLYVDNVPFVGDAPNDLPNVAGSSTSFFYTGVDPAGPRYGDYRVQQIQRFGPALTPTEVAQLYNSGRGLSYPNLGGGLNPFITHEVTGHTYAPGNRPVERPNIVNPGTGDLYDQTNTPSGLGHGFMPRASAATTAFDADLIHQTVTFAVAAKRATGALSAKLIHVTTLAISAKRATGAVSAKLIHQTTLIVSAKRATALLDVDLVHLLDIDAAASPATVDVDGKVVHQTSAAVQASRATADIDATLIQVDATITAIASAATADANAQVVHQTTDGSVAASRATAAIAAKRVVQATIGAQASPATASISAKRISQTSVTAQASTASTSISAQPVRLASVACTASRATSATNAQVVHQTALALQASTAIAAIDVTVTPATVNTADIDATASTATADVAAQVVHQTTDGSVAASRATAAISAKVVHQTALAAQASPATAAVSAKVVHQATIAAQASRATAAVSAKLIHQTSTAVSASRATCAINAELAGQIATSLALQAQRATASTSAKVVHQTTDGSVTAGPATTAIVAKRVIQATLSCSASRATCAINAQKARYATLAVSASRATASLDADLVHQTNLAVQATRATAALDVTTAGGNIHCQASRATAAISAQVIHQTNLAAQAARAQVALDVDRIHQTSVAVAAQRATAHLVAQFLYSATIAANASRATALVDADRIHQTTLTLQASRALAALIAKRIHQTDLAVSAEDATVVIVGGQGFQTALVLQAQRATAHVVAQVVHQTDLALVMNDPRVRILDYAIVWYTPVPILRLIPEGVELEVASGATILRPIPESVVLDVAPNAATIFLDIPANLP